MEEEYEEEGAGASVRSNYETIHKIRRLFSGGQVQQCPLSGIVVASSGDYVNFINCESGYPIHEVHEENDVISSFAVRPVLGEGGVVEVVIATKSFQLKHVTLSPETNQVEVLRVWKGHSMPTTAMTYDSTGTLLACCSSDGRIIIYDVKKGYPTHSFRGHIQPIFKAAFHPDPNRMMLVTVSQDSTVRCWDLGNDECKVLKSHMGAVTDMCFRGKKNYELVTVGRDRVITVWELRTYTKVSTIPVFEELEAVIPLPPAKAGSEWEKKLLATFRSGQHDSSAVLDWNDVVLTGGKSGTLKAWNYKTRKLIGEYTDPDLEFSLSHLLYDPQFNRIICVTLDHNFLMYDGGEFTRQQQVIGFLDEITDVRLFGSKCQKVVVGTNSKDLKMWDVEKNNWKLLAGHTDIVLGIAVLPKENLIASASKDQSVRVWRMLDGSEDSYKSWPLIGHTDAVNAVAFSKSGFVVSVSRDRTVKIWKLTWKKDKAEMEVADVYTAIGHTKEVNCVDISPSSQLLATGSIDKKVILWSVVPKANAPPKIVRKLTGHTRGVWDVKFNPVDKLLCSSSADSTIRIWDVSTGATVRVLEGHLNSVLRVSWMSLGTQLMSAGSDGLLKVWSWTDGECLNTIDSANVHEEKIWALDVQLDGAIFCSGSGDSSLAVWKDITKESANQKLVEEQADMAKKQEMNNSIRRGEYGKALTAALELDHWKKAREILEKMLFKDVKDDQSLGSVVKSQLSQRSLALLIYLCHEWNKRTTNSALAHAVIMCIFKTLTLSQLEAILQTKPSATEDSKTPSEGFDLVKKVPPERMLESFVAFSQRHFDRVDGLVSSSYVVDHCLELMGMPVDINLGKSNESKRARDQDLEDDREAVVNHENREDVHNREKRQKVNESAKKKKKKTKKKKPKHRLTADEEVIQEAHDIVHVTGEEAEKTPTKYWLRSGGKKKKKRK